MELAGPAAPISTEADSLPDVEHAKAAIARAMADDAEIDLSWFPQSASRSWAMAEDGLRFLIRLIRAVKPRHVMEFGSGVSTVALLRESHEGRQGFALTSIEHDPRYARDTLRYVGLSILLPTFSLSVAPLVERVIHGRYAPTYYTKEIVPASREPADVILVDGPPGIFGGRFGSIIQGLAASRPGAIVVIDDSMRSDEQQALQVIADDFADSVELFPLAGFKRGMSALVVRDPGPFASIINTLEPREAPSPGDLGHANTFSRYAGALRPIGEASRVFAGVTHPAAIASPGPNRRAVEFVRLVGSRSIAEIGISNGDTSLEFARHLNNQGQLHLFDFDDRVHGVLGRIAREGYTNAIGHGHSYKLMDSYTWSLKKLLEKQSAPIFDYVSINGAHTWAIDALAFFLIDRLLLPGGYISFADAGWTLAMSPSLRTAACPLTASLYTPEQVKTPQVAMIIDTLVRRDPRYEEVVSGTVFRKRSGGKSLNGGTAASPWLGYDAGRTLSSTGPPERSVASQPLVFVVGGLVDGPRLAEARDFPLLARDPNESGRNHIVRVARLIDSARLLGGAYLVVPRAHAGWLADHPRLIEYLGANFELVDANPASGLTFRL